MKFLPRTQGSKAYRTIHYARPLLRILLRLAVDVSPWALRIGLVTLIGFAVLSIGIYLLLVAYSLLMTTLAIAGIYIFPLVPASSGEVLIDYICSSSNGGCSREDWLRFLLINNGIIAGLTYLLIFLEEKNSVKDLTENPTEFVANALERRIYHDHHHSLGHQRPADLTGVKLLVTEVHYTEGGTYNTFEDFDYISYRDSIEHLLGNICEEANRQLRLRPIRSFCVLFLFIYTLMILGISSALLISMHTGVHVSPSQAVMFAFDGVQRGVFFDLYESYGFQHMYDGPSNFYFKSADFVIRTGAALSLASYLLGVFRLRRVRRHNLPRFDLDKGGELASVTYILALRRYWERLSELKGRLEAPHNHSGSGQVEVMDKGQFDQVFAEVGRILEQLNPSRLDSLQPSSRRRKLRKGRGQKDARARMAAEGDVRVTD